MLDANLLLRDGSTALTASELTPTGKDFGGPDVKSLTYLVIVPIAPTGTAPTLDVVIQDSTLLASGYGNFLTFPQITLRGIYFRSGKSPKAFRRFTATLTGTTPSFGNTIIAPDIAGEYDKF